MDLGLCDQYKQYSAWMAEGWIATENNQMQRGGEEKLMDNMLSALPTSHKSVITATFKTLTWAQKAISGRSS